MKLKLPILICLVLLMGRNSIAQIVLNQTSVNDYVTRICGPGITFSNATLTGDLGAIANFTGGVSGGLGATMNSGIVMSTGFVSAANTLQGLRSVHRSDNNAGPSIPALNAIAGAGTNDGIILEFDFIPITNQINVNFQFGSEEYNEYVNGGYNDAFAFFISGPGIVGTPNIAVVPGVGTPVTIDNINRGYAANPNCGGGCTNCAYYHDNCNSTFNNCMDGFTTMLTASQAVIPCSTYHIRLMIADGGDSIYDSWVFVQENGLFAVGNPPVALNASSGGGVGVFPEACSNALVSFTIPTAQPADYTFNVTYTGTATYGVDYSSLPTTITIPAGSTSVSIPVVIYADGITEGNETIIITYPATICETGVSTITIVDADPLTVTASNDTYICASGGSVPISATTAGGTGTVSYSWNNGAGTGSPVTVAPGATTTYTVTATDQCANVATDQVVVNVTNLTGLTATPSNCTTGNQYSVAGQVSFTAAPPTGTLTVTSSCGGTQTFNAPFTSPLSYNLTGLTANGANCTVTAAFSAVPCSITQNYTAPALPAIVASNDITFCIGGSTTISATGGSTYTWNNGLGAGASHTVSPTTTTTYTVTGTGANSCTNTDQVVVTVNPLPTIVASNDVAICIGGSTTISATGGSTYAWNNGLGAGASHTVSPTATTTYTVTGTDVNGCVNTDQVVVTVNPLPTIVASNDVAICIGGSTTISATGGSTYAWNNGLGAGASHTVSPTATTTYTVTGTDANGCVNTDQVVVTVNPLPTIVASNDVAICIGGSTTISATGGSTYAWNNGLGAGASHTVSPTATTTYTVTGTDANGCVNTDQVVVTVNPLPTIVVSNDVAICIGGSTTISATGGSTYAWNNGLGAGASHTVSPTATTTYTVTGTDANGCVNTDQVVVTVNPLPTIVASNDVAICIGGSTTISATGGSTYAWNNGLGAGASHTVSPIATTTYTVTGTDVNGCVNTDQVVVTVNPLPTIVASNDVAICIGGSTTISATGGSTYAWNNGLGAGASHTVSPIATTTYTVTGTDANGCVNTDQVVVTVNPLPTATIVGTTTVCQGDAAQTITFTGANGSSEYEFTYSLNGGASQTITTSGSNTVTITVPTTVAGTFTYALQGVEDVTTGCGQPQTGTAAVTVNPMPDATVAGTVVVCQQDGAPVITFTGTNSSGEYTFTYSLNGGADQTLTTSGTNTATVTVPTTTAGTFTYELLNVADPATGCNQDVNESQTVTVNPLPTATIAGTTTVCQGDAAQTITFTGANGSSDYEFTYSLNGGASQTITTSGSNTVTITVPTTVAGTFTYALQGVEDVTTGCGQPQTGTSAVTVNPMPDATVAGTVVVCQQDGAPVITFTGTNSSGEYTFTYSLNGGADQTLTTSGTNTATVTVPTTTAGTFTYELLNVADPATGCNQDVNESQTVTVNPLPTATIAGTTTVCQGDAAQTITFTGANGSSDYEFTYSLNGGASQTITTSGSNTVTITVPTTVAGTFTYALQGVEDVTTGCGQPQTGTSAVTVNPMPDATSAGSITVCQDDTAPVITFTGTNSSGEYTFTYSLNGGADQTLTTSGTNTATVTVPTTTAGTFTYELLNVADPATGCNQDVNESQTVTVNPLPTATIAGTTTVCQGDAAQTITFTGANGSSDYEFTYSLNGGASQTITTSGSNTVTITVPTTTAGTFTYALQGVEDVTTGCGQPQTGTAAVTVNPMPDATVAGTVVVCQVDGAPVITFTGTNSSGEYTFTYSLNGGADQTLTTSGTNTATVIVPTTTAGTFTYELLNVADPATGCNQDVNESQTVTVNPLPTATIAGTTTVCQGDAAQTITFTGANGSSDYEFTYSLNGGASQTITTSGSNTVTITVPTAAAGTFTYALQGVEDVTTGCGQPQTGTAAVTVNPMPDATVAGTVVVCQVDGAPVITFTGTNSSGEYTFTYSLNGGADQTLTTSGTNTATVTVPTTTAGTFTYELLNVADPATGCNQDVNESQTVTVNPLPTATIAGTTTVCQGDAAQTITFTGANGSSDYEFTYSLNGGASQTITTSGSNTVTITVPTTVAGTFTYALQGVEDVTTGCGQPQTGTAAVTVNPMPDATVAGTVVVCQVDGAPVITFTGTNSSGEYTFTYSLNGGADQTLTTSGTNTATVTVPTTTAGTFTYELLNVADPATGCNQDVNESQTVTVNPLPTATIAGTTTVCQGDAAQTITFTGANGSSDYEFTYSLNGGASQTITTSGSNTVTITVPTTTAGTFTYTLQSVADVTTGCGQPQTGTAAVTVNPMPDATVAGTVVVCQQDGAPVITFTGTNSSGEYTFTYSLNGGADQTLTTSGTNTATVTVPTTTAGTFTYELLNVADPATGCNQDVNESQTVTVNPLPTATIAGTTTVCQGDAAQTITFTGANGSSDYEFTYSLNGGASQTITTNGSNTVTITVPTIVEGTFTYTLQSVADVTTGCGQPQTGTATVTVNPMPDATSAGSITVCQDDTAPVITFTGTNSSGTYTFTYTINGGAPQTITTSGSNSANVTQSSAVPGTYVYELINVSDPATGCNRVISHIETIIIRQLPVATISNPVEACFQDNVLPEVQLTGANGDTPYTFTYNVNGGADQYATSTGSAVTLQVPTNVVGEFIYTITHVEEGSIYGCSQSQNIATMVTIHALPIVSAGNDFSVCAGQPVTLSGSGAATYEWNNNVTDGVQFTPVGTTTYTVEGTDIHGCENSDQVTVTVVPIPVVDIEGQNLYGCNPVIPTFTNNSTGNLTNCTWYFENGDVVEGCGTVSTVFDQPGCYDVTLVVSTPEGCSNTLTLADYVCVEPQPIASFYPNPDQLTSYNSESQMVNESLYADSYFWTFGDGSTPSTADSPVHEFPNGSTATYTIMLVASSNAGCVDTAYADVTVKEELLFYIPNTFTPDGDQYNNVFTPVFTYGYDPYDYTLLIFNRWGELIFESHDASIGWAGTYGADGHVCQEGTYTWKIEVKTAATGERKSFVGHVNILR